MLSRLLAALAAALVLTAPLPSATLADGDPASDVLLGENVFYPYSPQVPAAVQKSLNAQTAAAARAGFPIKVALIASPVDLGVIPDLFGKPQKYADFLDQEISFQNRRQPLLVVMSTGYGVAGLSPRATSAVSSVPKPAGKQSVQLAQAASTAVAKLAAADGHPISGAAGGGGSGSSSTSAIVITLIVAAILTAVALAVISIRRRRNGTPSR